MPDVYGEAYYHLIWATRCREEMILPRMEGLLYTYIRQKCFVMQGQGLFPGYRGVSPGYLTTSLVFDAASAYSSWIS